MMAPLPSTTHLNDPQVGVPRIGVSGVLRSWDGNERTGVNAVYVRAILAAGALPVLLSPLLGPQLAGAAIEGIDGLILTGGEDLDPAFYDEAPSPLLHAVSRERDLFELALFAAAREHALPILGICRGIQLINVGLGGTLYQDLPSERPSSTRHDADAARDDRTHGVRVQSDTLVAAALGTSTLRVNSLHHQGVKDLAPGLRATAWADDDLIEAVETDSSTGGGWLLAVQWHPEEMYADHQAPDGGLFRSLVREASHRGELARGLARGLMRAEVAEGSVG